MGKVIGVVLSVCMLVLILCSCSSSKGTEQKLNNNSKEEVQISDCESIIESTIENVKDAENCVEQMKSAKLQYPSQNDQWKYNVYDCYVEITEYLGNDVSKLVVPDKIDGLPVWVYNGNRLVGENDSIISIELPDSLLIIGKMAFSRCVKLKSINLPNGLIRICEGAFMGCEALENIIFPETLQVIEKQAFYGCFSLKEITLPAFVAEVQASAFDYTNKSYEKNSSGNIIFTGVTLTALNPNTAFGSNGFKSIGNVSLIRGYVGSTAAQYCADNKIKFEAIE